MKNNPLFNRFCPRCRKFSLVPVKDNWVLDSHSFSKSILGLLVFGNFGGWLLSRSGHKRKITAYKCNECNYTSIK